MQTLSYDTISRAEDKVIGALESEGGELSYPELMSVTRLPYEYMSSVVGRLETEKRVEVVTEGKDPATIRLVRLLRPRHRWAFF